MSLPVQFDGKKIFPFFIDGKWRLGSDQQVSEDLNPFTNDVYAHVAQASKNDVEDAITAAYRARNNWQAMLASNRGAILLKAAEVIAARTDELCDVLIDETGSVFGKAMFEIGYCVELLHVAAALVYEPRGEVMAMTKPGQIGLTIRQPLGVIAGISPFNFPFLLALKKIAFALATGNTFILKPSSLTPVIGLKIAEIFEAAGLPPGVLNIITGSSEMIGEKLVADPRINMVTFTGSVSVGQALAAQAGKYMKRITLELGGKSPLIILKDADIDYAVNCATFGIFLHQGQVCMASSRVIIEKPLFKEFCKRFVLKTKSLKIGDPRDPDTVIGPLISRLQFAVIDRHLQDAISKGARLLCGGRHKDSHYLPTILAGVTREMEIFTSESFGPIVSIICVENSEEALAVANDSSYGLTSAIITNDMQKAFDLSLRLEAGMVHLNDSTLADEANAPFGGVKNSGFGREGGHAAIAEMTEIKWITLQLGNRNFPF